jgi:hypothetical protein
VVYSTYMYTGVLGLLFVRQSVRTTGGRRPIFKQHNSKVSPFKNTYGQNVAKYHNSGLIKSLDQDHLHPLGEHPGEKH